MMITMVSVVSAGCSGKNTNSESVSGSAETSETSSSTILIIQDLF